MFLGLWNQSQHRFHVDFTSRTKENSFSFLNFEPTELVVTFIKQKPCSDMVIEVIIQLKLKRLKPIQTQNNVNSCVGLENCIYKPKRKVDANELIVTINHWKLHLIMLIVSGQQLINYPVLHIVANISTDEDCGKRHKTRI